MFHIDFQPIGRRGVFGGEQSLLDCARELNVDLVSVCGGAGNCNRCKVKIVAGQATQLTADENAALRQDELEQGYRLACQCRVNNDLVVEIPESSLFQSNQKILAHDEGGHLEVKPSVSKKCVKVAKPLRDDPRSDSERFKEALGGNVTLGIHTLQALPQTLRQSDFVVTAVLKGNLVIDIEAGDTTSHCYGLAFDIGSTTLVGTLINLCTGKEMGVVSMVNPQTSFGDDVISRIKRCREEQDGLAKLHEAVINAVNAMIEELAAKAEIKTDDIWEAVFAGNSTMQEIFCGINPFTLGEIPFVPAFRERVRMKASDIGIHIHPAGEISVFPQIGGFVGGDTVAGIVATRLDKYEETPVLLVDVGTNGEIVLAHNGKMIATSVAAGPAFEGARIVNGMRATAGAIEKVVIDGDVEVNIIGNVKPSGICGTGLIDAVACLLRRGIIDETGRILGPDEIPSSVSNALRARIVNEKDHFNFVLVPSKATATGEPICLYQRDVRELQLANAAIRAGITILLRHEGLVPEDLKAILLAGGFGNFIRRNNACRIGMLPPIETTRIRFVGNTSSFGAKRALLSFDEWIYAEEVVKETKHIDLSLDPEFQNEFSMAMIFPGPEVE